MWKTIAIIYFIITFVVLLVIGYVIYWILANKKAIQYAYYNKLGCDEHNGCSANILTFKESPDFQTPYSNMMSYFLCNLINIVYKDKVKGNIPTNLTSIETLNNGTESIPFGVILQESKTKNLYIIFRGTINTKEWMQDFNMDQTSVTNLKFKPENNDKQVQYSLSPELANVKIHSGFMEIYNSFKDKIVKTIQKTKPSNIIIAGHSLGAAIATIAGVDLNSKGYKPVTYAFASPRVGNETFKKIVSDNKIILYRIVNDSDIIPTLPPSVVPNLEEPTNPFFYEHCGQEITFTDNRFSYMNNHIISCYMDQMAKKLK